MQAAVEVGEVVRVAEEAAGVAEEEGVAAGVTGAAPMQVFAR